MANLDVATWLGFAAWMVLGLVIYLSYGRTHAKLAPGKVETLAD